MSLERVKSDASRSTILFKWKNSRSCQTTPFMSALLLQLGLWLFVSSFQSPYTPQYNAACLIPEKFFSNDTRHAMAKPTQSGDVTSSMGLPIEDHVLGLDRSRSRPPSKDPLFRQGLCDRKKLALKNNSVFYFEKKLTRNA
ncbi:hypothetical protein KQX54_020736 [Cotesia glomerata]|uniref:Uncharacterized protein n=1 Tax=Cotesia glomerata TaxID=32391 RepID=A0AAV7IHT6_COTGL|nr:hypothetical protein KQX54_020736 [Cotesia glomerata]